MTRLQRAWTAVRTGAPAAWTALLAVLVTQIDTRSVRIFQMIMYLWFAVAGFHMSVLASPPEIVSDALGPVVYTGWAWLNIVGGVLVAVGVWLPYTRRFTSDGGKRTANGLVLQFVGDLTMTFVLGTYVLSSMLERDWSQGIYAPYGYIGLTMCAGLLVVADLRRLRTETVWEGGGQA